jgi:nucleotide-binding universal stress UspA family protein
MTEKEKPTGKILVAADGSPAAEVAAGVAIQVAAGQKLPVHGLYVLDEVLALDNTYTDVRRELGTDGTITSRSQLLGLLEAQGSMVLDALQGQCQSVGVPATTEMLFGGVPELVLQQAAGAELLAMGRRGHGHAGDPDRLGRNFRAIARRVGRPILVGGDDMYEVHRLLLAYNGSSRAQNALAWVSRLRDTLPAEISRPIRPGNGWMKPMRSSHAVLRTIAGAYSAPGRLRSKSSPPPGRSRRILSSWAATVTRPLSSG